MIRFVHLYFQIVNITIPVEAYPINSNISSDSSCGVPFSCRLRIDGYFPFVFGEEIPSTCGYGAVLKNHHRIIYIKFQDALSAVQSKTVYSMQLKLRVSKLVNP